MTENENIEPNENEIQAQNAVPAEEAVTAEPVKKPAKKKAKRSKKAKKEAVKAPVAEPEQKPEIEAITAAEQLSAEPEPAVSPAAEPELFTITAAAEEKPAEPEIKEPEPEIKPEPVAEPVKEPEPVKTEAVKEEPRQVPDILYVMGKGNACNDDELISSLSNIEKYACGYGRIFISGPQLSRFINKDRVIWHKYNEDPANFEDNIDYQIRAVCRETDISDNFILMIDNIFLDRPVDLSSYPVHYRREYAVSPTAEPAPAPLPEPVKEPEPVKTEAVKEEPRQVPDILYVLGKGSIWNNSELKFSLRSLQKYGRNYGRVFIAGPALPSFLNPKKVIWVKYNDNPAKNKWLNVFEKILHTLNSTDISSRFILMMDDVFLNRVNDFLDLPYYAHGDLEANYNTKRNWKKSKAYTCEVLIKEGYTHHNFEIHGPIAYEKDRFIKMAASAYRHKDKDNFIQIRSYYCNIFGVTPAEIEDKKIKRAHIPHGLHDIEPFISGSPFYSASDEGLLCGLAKYVSNRYIEKSYWEAGSAISRPTF